MSRAGRNRRIVNHRATRRGSSNNSGCALFVIALPALAALGGLAGWLTGGAL